MLNFPKFVNSLKFKLIAHFLILTTLFLNVINIVQIQDCQSQNQVLINNNNQLTRSLQQLDNQEAYQNSSLFKEKELKNRNYILPSEQVVDVSSVEKIVDSTGDNYIPKTDNKNQTNFQKWLNGFGSFKTNLLVQKC
jgi:hypothetical protein